MIYTSIGVECSKLMKLHADTLGKGRVMSVKPMTRLVVLDFIRIGAAIVVLWVTVLSNIQLTTIFTTSCESSRKCNDPVFMLSGLVNFCIS